MPQRGSFSSPDRRGPDANRGSACREQPAPAAATCWNLRIGRDEVGVYALVDITGSSRVSPGRAYLSETVKDIVCSSVIAHRNKEMPMYRCILISTAFLGVAGCVNVQKEPVPASSTTYLTPAPPPTTYVTAPPPPPTTYVTPAYPSPPTTTTVIRNP
jgi:hypothetical protein